MGPGLARQGRRDAVIVVVQIAKAWQDRQKALQSDLKQAEKLEPAPRPSTFRGTAKAWEERANREREEIVAKFRERVERHQAEGRAVHDALTEMTRSRGLTETPEWNGKPHAAWNAWLGRHRNELPESVATPAPSAGR